MSPARLPHRPLGASGLEVSRLSLGSWRTYERLSFETGAAIMAAARERGIDFLDDARYDDETGTAPLRTGYSEVRFGELFRAVEWPRDEAVISNKLWWEFWPEQSAVEELEASLGRMGLDRVDLIYSFVLPEGLEVPEAVEQMAPLLDSGRARAWGLANWDAEGLAEATRAAAERGMPPPCAIQLPYSLIQRDWVESEAMETALEDSGAAVVASFVLAGGVLSGKYGQAGAAGRAAASIGDPEQAAALEAGERLRALAERLDTSPAALAVAFTLEHPRVASTLFGATSPEQLEANASALDLAARLTPEDRAELQAIGRPDARAA
jgi:aryl-alcohol dehydrogenase-like predicted oxidoreductase